MSDIGPYSKRMEEDPTLTFQVAVLDELMALRVALASEQRKNLELQRRYDQRGLQIERLEEGIAAERKERKEMRAAMYKRNMELYLQVSQELDAVTDNNYQQLMVELNQPPADKLLPVFEDTMTNWIELIHDNERSMGDRLQSLSSTFRFLLEGKTFPPFVIREQRFDDLPKCWCETCRPVSMDDLRMVLCPTCGNKRCPHAFNHVNACTGSNEPGQVGSAYENQAPFVADEKDDE